MRYYDEYDSDEFDEDYDDQDGTHFKDYEPKYENNDSAYSTVIDSYEQKSLGALLYIREHYDELINDEAYKKAYNRLLNEMIRKLSYFCDDAPICTVTDEDRKRQENSLDNLIQLEGKRQINKYKDDAAYIVDLINSGKV